MGSSPYRFVRDTDRQEDTCLMARGSPVGYWHDTDYWLPAKVMATATWCHQPICQRGLGLCGRIGAMSLTQKESAARP